MIDSSSSDKQADKIIEHPENYEKMIHKLKKQDEEQVARFKKKKKSDETDPVKIAQESLQKRAARQGKKKTLKDRTILRQPEDKKIQELRDQLAVKSSLVAAQIITQLTPQAPKEGQ